MDAQLDLESALPRDDVHLATDDLVGNYRVDCLLAEGGMGSVYLVTHRYLPRRAALKVLRAEMLSTKSAREGLLQEAAILERLAHPGIAHVFDLGVLADGRPWLAIELVEGELLSEMLARRGRMSPREVCEVALELLGPLEAAHAKNIIHRDIKPENIMFHGEGPSRQLKLLDWGIAHIVGTPELHAEIAAGTPQYMAPEQVRGEPVDGRTDLYAIGMVLYELLTGASAFSHDTPMDTALAHLRETVPPLAEKRDDLPDALVELVHALVAKSPDARPTLAKVRDALVAIVNELDRAPLALELDYTETDTPSFTRAQPAFATDVAPTAPRARWTPQAPTGASWREPTRPSLRMETETERLKRVWSSDGHANIALAGVINARR